MTFDRLILTVLYGAAVGSCPFDVAAGDRAAGTLNFQNVTTLRVFPTVPEVVNNEKGVEYGDFDNDGDFDGAIANVDPAVIEISRSNTRP